MANPSLSADGQRVAGYRTNPVDGSVDVWLLDVSRGTSVRVTSNVADDTTPVWSPDDTRIVFGSNRKGHHSDLFMKTATASGKEELLLATPQDKVAADWSRDGRFVLFDLRDFKSRSDIWAVPLNGQDKPFPVIQTEFDEFRGQFSPDGNWIAYQSDESGRHEIYVQAFPGPGPKATVSTNGGTQVRWRRDGKELFYVALDGRLMAVPIELGSSSQTPDVGKPVALFRPPLGRVVLHGDFRHHYAVSQDGGRFLVAAALTETITSPISLILNWKARP